MEQHRFKIHGFLLRSLLLIQLVYSINQNQFGMQASQSELSDRMLKIESKNLNFNDSNKDRSLTVELAAK